MVVVQIAEVFYHNILKKRMSNNAPSKEQMQKIFSEVTDSEYECENFIGSGAYAVVW